MKDARAQAVAGDWKSVSRAIRAIREAQGLILAPAGTSPSGSEGSASGRRSVTIELPLECETELALLAAEATYWEMASLLAVSQVS